MAFFVDELVEHGIAKDVAAAWASRASGRWVSGGAACSSVESPIFDLASVTKPMTAVAFARSGIDRRTRLAELLPETAGTASADIPLELLLAHRAGLEAHLQLEVDSREDTLRLIANARRADAAFALPEDGFAPVYSDLGYILAGEALARATRAADPGEAIEHLALAPLGASDLGTARKLGGPDFNRRVRPTEVVAWRGGEVRGVVHDENAWALTGTGGSGHAGMFGTASAVLAFGQAVLDALSNRGLYAGADLAWLVAPRPGGSLRAGFDGKSTPSTSLGDRAGPRTFGHLGFTGTSLWIDPDAEAVIVLLTNRVHPSRDNTRIRAARPRAHDALFELAAGFVPAERSA